MAEEQDDSEKTEDPTARRLEEARKKGQVAQSREVATAVLLGLSTVIVFVYAPFAVREMGILLRGFIAYPERLEIGMAATGGQIVELLVRIGVLVGPIAIALVAGAILSSVLQNAVVWTSETLQPKLERISLVKGFGRLFSLQSLVEFAKSLVKFIVVTIGSVFALWPNIDSIAGAFRLTPGKSLAFLGDLTNQLLLAVIVLVAALAAADWFYQYFKFMQDMRMSKQDIKDEFKQQEGDPMIKSRLRAIRMEKARNRMMADVPRSTVVITNPTHFAIALRYEAQTMSAPVLVAKGADLVASRIRDLAIASNVPIVENPPLARALFRSVDIGNEVPPDHYKAVAEVISFVLRQRR